MRLSTEAQEDDIVTPAPAVAVAVSGDWRRAIWLTAASILGILFIHAATLGTILRVWHQDRAFAHCYFIAPLAGYMMWLDRERLAMLRPRPSVWGLCFVTLWGFAWFLATMAQVQFGAQLALVGMIIAAVWATLGWGVVREVAYPLAFLFLAVPFGEAFFPILISMAGRLAVMMVTILGAPIAFDGHYLRLPGAEWRVAEACGGLRFILALLAVGAVFAYTTYRKAWKRAAFLVTCVALAVLTNGVRVSAIVLIGYFTDMKSSIVHEHTWLGWLLFAIMALTLFFLGRHWADPDPPVATSGPAGEARRSRGAKNNSYVTAMAATLAIVLAWSLGAQAAQRPMGANTIALTAPTGADGWTALDYPLWDWSPNYEGARASFGTTYQKGNRTALAYVAYYRNQGEGSELVHAENGVVSLDPHDTHGYRYSVDTQQSISVGNRTVEVIQTDIRSPLMNLRVWRWYWTPSRIVTSPVSLKLLTLRSKLTGKGDDAAGVVIATPFDTRPEDASQTLTSFLTTMLPRMDGALRKAAATRGTVVK